MELNEVIERLSALEGAAAADQEATATRGFIDKYGAGFSGDEGIGMAILAELNRRGVDSAAVGADKVVQEILDSIRAEATMLLDKIKAQTAEVSALMDEVQTIQDAVASATGAAPGDGMMDAPIEALPLPGPEAAALPPEAMAPPEGGMPPAPEGMPMEPAAPPPEEMLPPTEEAPPPVASDTRVKKLVMRHKSASITVPSDARIKGWKPSANLLAAVRGR